MDKLVTLVTCSNSGEAYILKGVLAGRGIESFIFDEQSAINTPLVVGVRLVVRQQDEESAKKILSEEIQQVGSDEETRD